MTDITLPRAVVEQALEALRHVVRQAQENLVPTIHYGPVNDVMNRLEAALAEPVQEPVAWMYTGVMSNGIEHGPHLIWKPESMDAMSASKGVKAAPLYTAPPQQAEPVCPDCRGIGYDASGQLCACQQNPSF